MNATGSVDTQPVALVRLPEIMGFAIMCVVLAVVDGVLGAVWCYYLPGKGNFIFHIYNIIVPGLALAWIAKWLHVHRVGAAVGISLLFSVVMPYMFWWMTYSLITNAMMPFVSPATLMHDLVVLSKNVASVDYITGETHAIAKSQAQAFMVMTTCALAAAAILTPIVLFVGSRWWPPYCSRCSQWFTCVHHQPLQLGDSGPRKVAYEAQHQRYEPLMQLKCADPQQPHLLITLLACPSCEAKMFMTLHQFTPKDPANGQDQSMKVRLASNLPVPDELAAHFRALSSPIEST